MAIVVSDISPALPITLDEAKQHLLVDGNEQDEYIRTLIQAAQAYAENYTNGLALSGRTVKEYRDGFCCLMELSVFLADNVSEVAYMNDANQWVPVSAAVYSADVFGTPARITLNENQSWPRHKRGTNVVRITYTAGGAEPPALIKHAMKLMIAFWYENREDIAINESKNPRVRSADRLLDTQKMIVI